MPGRRLPPFRKSANRSTKDLGFTIRMQATENADLLNRFLSQSSAIDVGDVSIVFMKHVVGRNVLQAIPVSKYKYWDQTIPLFTKGVYPDGRKASTQGVAPYSVLYATGADGQKFSKGPSDWLTGIQTITNADTLGIRPDLVGRPISSWADLISPEFKGRAALQDQPNGRGHRCLDGSRGERPPAIRKQGQHDPRRDRQNYRADARHQEIRAIPLLLDDLRPVGEPDGLGRGGDPVDVVAGGDRRAYSWHPVGLPAAEGGISRLGLHIGADEASEWAQARLLLRIHELAHLGLPGRVHRA
jgi:hypothetical protein